MHKSTKIILTLIVLSAFASISVALASETNQMLLGPVSAATQPGDETD